MWFTIPGKKQSNVFPGRLQRKRPRPRKSSPGSSKIEARGGQNGLLEASGSFWAAVGRQLACKTAPEAFLGGAGVGLGRSWAALGASLGRLGPPRRSPAGPWEVVGSSGEGLREAIVAFFVVVRQKKLQKKIEKALKSSVVLS